MSPSCEMRPSVRCTLMYILIGEARQGIGLTHQIPISPLKIEKFNRGTREIKLKMPALVHIVLFKLKASLSEAEKKEASEPTAMEMLTNPSVLR